MLFQFDMWVKWKWQVSDVKWVSGALHKGNMEKYLRKIEREWVWRDEEKER